MKKFNPLLPDLTEVKSVLPWKEIPPVISFGKIVNLISNLFNLDSMILFTDIWMYLCLGLRPNELKRAKVLT